MNEDKMGEVSDGYHTFDELYEHRHSLMLALMRCLPYCSWFSRCHDDGSSFDGWFICGIDLPRANGTVTYHLPERLWATAVATGAKKLELERSLLCCHPIRGDAKSVFVNVFYSESRSTCFKGLNPVIQSANAPGITNSEVKLVVHSWFKIVGKLEQDLELTLGLGRQEITPTRGSTEGCQNWRHSPLSLR